MPLTPLQERYNILSNKYGLPDVFLKDDSIHPFWINDFNLKINMDYFEQLCIMRNYNKKVVKKCPININPVKN